MLQKKIIKIWDVNVDNIVISKLVKTKTNSKYLIGFLDKAIRPLLLIMRKMSGFVKTFNLEDKNNKLMSFHIDDKKLLGKYKDIWTYKNQVNKIYKNQIKNIWRQTLSPSIFKQLCL